MNDNVNDKKHTLTLPSPAKINLFLHINGKRDDGYHLLQTIFQFLDIHDTIEFTYNHQNTISLSCDDKTLETDDNLIIRAAKVLKPFAKDDAGIDIHLTKVLPMGGGVGGGSSNAATTLLALNHLWQLNLSEQKLCELGLTLGADVPVFVKGQSVFAEGVGEVFTELTGERAPKEMWYLLAMPPCHISTASIFTHPQLPRNTKTISPHMYSFENTKNDCQGIAKKLYPEVANTIERLLEYAPTRLTGTGACIFSCFEDKQSAEKAIAYLPKGVKGTVTKGQNISATRQRLFEIFS